MSRCPTNVCSVVVSDLQCVVGEMMANWLSRPRALSAFLLIWLKSLSVSPTPKSYQELMCSVGTSNRSEGLMKSVLFHHGSPKSRDTMSSQSVGGELAFLSMSSVGRLHQIFR